MLLSLGILSPRSTSCFSSFSCPAHLARFHKVSAMPLSWKVLILRDTLPTPVERRRGLHVEFLRRQI